MPAKRRAPGTAPDAPAAKGGRRSALAKEHDITAAQESEIREAFSLFCADTKIKDDSQIAIADVRRALKALDLQPSAPEMKQFLAILDPENEGIAVYSSFVGICGLKLSQRGSEGVSEKEVEDAFRLFAAGGEEKITLGVLRRVAKVLKEEVDEQVLRDMILEANGGVGVGQGVGKEEFEGVMRRAGVWK